MSQFGHISEIFIGRDTTTNVHKGYAFVTFSHVKDLKTLFGAHLFKGKSMEVKRNLHNHAILDRVAPEIKEKDIFQAAEALGFMVAEVIVGLEGNGVPIGQACVKLQNDEDLSRLLSSGKIKVKDFYLPFITRSRRLNQVVPVSSRDNFQTKKPKNVRGFNPGQHEDYGLTNNLARKQVYPSQSNEGFEELELLRIHKNSFSKISVEDSAQSTFDASCLQDNSNLSSAKKLRKDSASFKTTSKEYYPSVSMAGSLALLSEDPLVDDDQRVLLNGRHKSECTTGSTENLADKAIGRRLSSYSSCFYSGGSPVHKEVKIDFFTYPGRD